MFGPVLYWWNWSLSLRVPLVAHMPLRSCCLYSSLYLCTFASIVVGADPKDRCLRLSFHRWVESHIRPSMCSKKAALDFVEHCQGDQGSRNWVKVGPQALLLDMIPYRSHQGAHCSMAYPQICSGRIHHPILALFGSLVEKFGPYCKRIQPWTTLVTYRLK